MTTTATEKSWSDMTDKERAAHRRRQAAADRKAAKQGMANATTPEMLAAGLVAHVRDGWSGRPDPDGKSGWSATSGVGWSDGWETIEPGSRWSDERNERTRHVVFERDVCKVVLNVVAVDDADKWTRQHAYRGCTVEGHTLVENRSFTRRGIDSSSCALVAADCRYPHQYGDVAALLVGEYERCRASVERSKTLEPVPGLPYRKQPEWFAAAGATLRDGKVVTLTPHGMGTGHTLSRRRSPFAQRADAALEQRLGLSPIYVATFDHD